MDSVIGAQIGQGRDPSAITVAEVHRRAVGERVENHFVVRYLSRLPPGTSYPEIVQRMVEVSAGAEARTDATPRLYVDATGALPVLDLFSEQALYPVACHFNHGGRRNEVDRYQIAIGKGFLVTRMKVLFQTSRLHLPGTEEAHTLRGELLEYDLRLEDDADNRPGAFRVGTHDDLVTALGLAVQDETGFGPSISVDRSLCGW